MVYKTSLENISTGMLKGFFVGWPNPPSPETHLKLLKNSSRVILALNDEADQVVGFVTAITDNVLAAYIPFLEVLPQYQNKGIGQELLKQMLKELNNIYMIDLCCDDGLISYYEKFNMIKSNGMVLRNYKRQSGLQNQLIHSAIGKLAVGRVRTTAKPKGIRGGFK